MYDILFIHPPAMIRKKPGQVGFMDSETGYGNQFPSFPVGLMNLANEIDCAGYNTAILNLASEYAKEKVVNLDSLFKRNAAKIFAISFHWAVHADSVFFLAEYLKKKFPDSIIILGGLSATYFRKEIKDITSSVDAVILGECDQEILNILKHLLGKTKDIPNNFFDLKTGKESTLISPPNQKFNYTRYDLVFGDESDFSKKRANIPLLRGCAMDCVFCGGSCTSYRDNFCRKRVGHPDIKDMAEQFQILHNKGREYIFLYGDLRLLPKKTLELFFSEIKELDNDIVFRGELFFPITDDYLASWKKSGKNIGFSMSPETSNDNIRMKLGRLYKNSQIEKQIPKLAENNIHQTYFFMSPLPYETRKDNEEKFKFMDKLYSLAKPFKEGFVGNPIFSTMGFMMMIDPGSILFKNPEKFGVTNHFNSLKTITQSIADSTSWTDLIGFETDLLKKQDIKKLIKDSIRLRLDLHLKYNDITEQDYNRSIKELA